MTRLLFIAGLLGVFVAGATAATIHVPADYLTIGQAIAASHAGDEIVVSPGTYNSFGGIGNRLTIRSTFDGKNWSLVENTVVKYNIEGSIVEISNGSETSGTVLRGFHFTRDPIPNPPYGYDGRGIISDGAPYATIEDCIIENCLHATDQQGHGGLGGAIQGISGVIQNNIIRNNAAAAGAAIYGGNAVIRNNVMYNNGPSGIATNDATIINNTLFDAGRVDLPGGAVVMNNIFWTSAAVSFGYSGPPPRNCVIKGFTGAGLNIITADPQFVDSANGDFHLKSTSPCIDAGLTTTTTNAIKADFEGVQRGLKGNAALPGPGKIDIGAFEYIPKPVAVWLPGAGPDLIHAGDTLAVAWQMDLATAGTAIGLGLFDELGARADFGFFYSATGAGVETVTLPAWLPAKETYFIRGASNFDRALTADTPPMTILRGDGAGNAARRGAWVVYR